MDHSLLEHSSIPPAGWLEVFLWLLGRRKRFRVHNDSMQPLLRPGQEVLARPGDDPKPGEVWVLRHPEQPELKIVKTVTGLHPDGGLEVRGLNLSCSQDSRQFGAAAVELFVGKVESIFWTPRT